MSDNPNPTRPPIPFLPLATIVAGDLMIATGILFYFGAEAMGGKQSLTALIPAGIGLVFNLLGGLALAPKLRKHMMHATAALSLLLFLALAGMSAGNLVRLAQGQTVERPQAVIAQGITAALCLLLLAACVVSFMKARSARRSA